MRFLKIKDIGKVFSGATPKTGVKEYWDGEIPWVTPKEINKLSTQYLSDTERKISEIGLKSCSANMLPKGSILFTSRAPIGLVAIAEMNVCTNQGFKSIVLNEGFDSLYIYYALKYYTKELNDLGTGTTFKELSKSTFEKFEIPVPSYVDQIKIGTLLSKVESLIKKQSINIESTDDLLISTFHKMFGDPFNNQNKLEKVKIGTVCKVTKLAGYEYTKHINYQDEGDIAVVRGLNVKDGRIKLKNLKYIDNKTSDYLIRSKLNKGDVVITYIGINIGEVAIIEEDNKFHLAPNVAKVTPIQTEIINSFYLLSYLMFNRYLFTRYTTNTAKQALNMGNIREIEILLPDIKQQTHFATFSQNTERLKNKFKKSLVELENLFGSLSQKAFKGELDLSKLVIDESLLPKEKKTEKQAEIINPAILKALDAANSISKHFEKTNELAKAANRFNKYFEQWDKLTTPLNKLPKLPTELIEAQQRIEKIQAAFANVKPFKPKKSEKVTWEKVSTQQVSNWIKENYTGYHFTSEMLIRFLMDEHITFPDYYSSEELKKYPQTNEADDLKSLIFSAISKQNPYLKLEQIFYNAEKENVQLKITEEDYTLIKERSAKNRSGIYFTIAE